MKRKLIKLSAVLAVAFTTMLALNVKSVKADTWGQWVYEVNDYEATVTGYTGSDTNVNIPASINGKVVVALRGTFYNNKRIKTVYIPDSVKIIDSVWGGGSEVDINGYAYWDSCDGTFEGCSNLTTVKGAKGVNAYAEETFKQCVSLKSIRLYNISLIPGKMFLGCSSLREITIPDSVTNVAYWSFAECTSLRKVSGGKKVTEYGEGAFRCCKKLSSMELGRTKTIPLFMFYRCKSLAGIKIPTTVTSIQYSAFAYSGLKSVKLPSSLEYIGGGREDETDREGAFEHCVKLTKVTGGKNVKVYGVCAFKDCKQLKSFSFGKVTKIQRFVFAGCSSLNNVTLPSTVRVLGTGAFRDCKKIRTLKLPNKLTTIEPEALWGCDSLKNLVIPRSVTFVTTASIPMNRTVYVYKGSKAAEMIFGLRNVKYV